MSVGIIGRKARKNTPSKRKRGLFDAPLKATPINVVSSSFAGSDCTLTFDVPVSLTGVPKYRNQADALPTAATVAGPMAITLTYAGTVTSVTVPYQDPAVRNPSGGYVQPTTVESP